MAWNKRDIKAALKIPALFCGFIIGVHIINVLTGMQLNIFGVFPRDIYGLPGIITSPLIHGSFQHLFSNVITLFTMMFVILLFYPRVAVSSFVLIYVLTGLSVWLLARSVFHIGASGVVYGLISFVFWLGIFRRSIKSIVLALIMIFMYHGYFAGILPNQEGISWESHLLGGLVGIFVAFVKKGEVEEDEVDKPYDWELEEEEKEPFLPRDAFDKTKEERARENYFDYWNQDDTWSK
ncbi:MAG: rhomboid family intramembrane serine protease [Saprospiraceae bacterium]|nr:rhomboid family intramembrane serine protease [Saprospiraceae bacterium]